MFTFIRTLPIWIGTFFATGLVNPISEWAQKLFENAFTWTQSITDLFDKFQQFFAFIPTPFFVILGVSIVVILLLRIFGR